MFVSRLTETLRLLLLASLAAALGACGNCNNEGTPPDGGGDGDGAVGDATTPDADPACVGGTLCGEPATCCAAGMECAFDQCLPACATGVRCGADQLTCCDAGDVCLVDACVTPGAACGDSFDCPEGEFCEPTLGQCLPQPDPLACEYVPVFDTLDVALEWAYEAGEIISIPVVADLDGAGAPEVVVNLTVQDGGTFFDGRIAVLDGATGAVEVAPIPHAPPTSYGSHGKATIAIGDVSGDGAPDIVYTSREDASYTCLIVAVDRTGALLWTSHDAGGERRFGQENGAITLANFDDDPQAEVVMGATLLDHDGTVVWEEPGPFGGPHYGTNSGYFGGIAAVADLDGDGEPEIVTGRHAWKVSWTPGDPPVVVVTPYWAYAGDDGYPAIADLDGDGDPEVVLVAAGHVIALDGQTGALWCGTDPTGAACAGGAPRTPPLAIPGGDDAGRGGPPTIADFDADGRPEIGVAGGASYSLYDLARAGEDIVQPAGDPAPAPGAIFVRWSAATQDLSSNATGSSVFDFQGDGVAEVVYGDECYMRVYRGTDGAIELEVPSSTATIHEYPLVVDVDGDNNSEILIVANQSNNADDCPSVPGRQGLFVYGDAADRWVPTRKVWTQHAYHVTNATSAGNVPTAEADNWDQPGLNNYRQNVQGDGIFNAPDLALELSAGLAQCGVDELELRARVTNLGALGVPMGVEVTFWRGTDASGELLGAATTTAPLLPGNSTIVTLTVAAPDVDTDYYAAADTAPGPGGGVGIITECDETNNGDRITEAACPVVD